MTQFSQRIYRHLRPILYRLKILSLARRLFSEEIRQRIAIRIGLGGFDISSASRNVMPSWAKSDRESRLSQSSLVLDGINLVADLRADLGISEAARSLLESINATNLPVTYTEFPYRFTSRTEPVPPDLPQGAPYSFTLIHINPSSFYDALLSIPDRTFRHKYVIAIWYWELVDFPAQWHSLFQFVDEIWVVSGYIQSIIAKVSPVPVTNISLAINIKPSANTTRQEFDLPPDRFIFLYSFNPASSIARKNPFGLIEAFRRAFGNSESGPLLVIKTHHLDTVYGTAVAAPLTEALATVGGKLITQNLSRQKMNDLISQCDCYISLHRAEGFGLGIAEAMALGKPVIATAYSGNLDYMTATNSYGVRYALRPINKADHEYQPFVASIYPIGQQWAEPDLDHAALYMTYVFENPIAAQLVGLQAQKDISMHHSSLVVGQNITQRLQVIASQHNISTTTPLDK